MNEKFKHFLELLELAEKNEEPLKITNQDLEGYWELVRIQVNVVFIIETTINVSKIIVTTKLGS